MTAFGGFGEEAFTFFEALEARNHKDTFEAHRRAYEEDVRAPLAALLGEMATRHGGRVKLFRPHRQRRFHPHAPPYKTTCYGVVHDVPDSAVGWYAEVSAAGFYVARGFHDMARDQLDRFRRAVDRDDAGKELQNHVREAVGAGLSVSGDALQTVPRGHRKDHPRVLLLRRKALAVGRRFRPSRALHTRRAASMAIKAWCKADRVATWLDQYVGPSEIPPEVRYGGQRKKHAACKET